MKALSSRRSSSIACLFVHRGPYERGNRTYAKARNQPNYLMFVPAVVSEQKLLFAVLFCAKLESKVRVDKCFCHCVLRCDVVRTGVAQARTKKQSNAGCMSGCARQDMMEASTPCVRSGSPVQHQHAIIVNILLDVGGAGDVGGDSGVALVVANESRFGTSRPVGVTLTS